MGPCAWIADHSGHSPEDLAEWLGYPLNIQNLADDLGCKAMWGFTGRQYDECPRTVRPILACTHRSLADLDAADADGFTYLGNGAFIGYPPSMSSCCARVDPKTVILEPPVYAITQVKVDGVVVAPANYRVDESTRLVRIDENAWPTWQNIATDDTVVGSFSVTYIIGLGIPTLLEQMAGTLALEIARGICGSTLCRLPSRATEIIRQGTTVMLSDPEWLMENGRTGIPEVDLAIGAYNPAGIRSPYRVIAPLYYPTVTGA
jgi:hypothetical protein